MLKWIMGMCAAVMIAAAHAAIKEEPVTYSDGTTTMKGFVVYDDGSTAKRPGLVVVPEWWGITPNTHREARDLAKQGYTAFIADMFGDAKSTDDAKEAGALSGSVMKNPAVMEARFEAARKTLAGQPSVDPARIGAVGFCFGGAVVLNMARVDHDLAGVAAFHPSGLDPVVPRATPGSIKAKLLVMNGADDPFNKADAIERFKQEMSAAHVDMRYISYPGAVHAFTNPDATAAGKKFNLPLAYNERADKESKAEASKFLASVLKK
ncbi:MAG TPA: dienelactone hydrolase family protein [Burkholderiales bacterium]|nr:dienelactone hydrolase family protein [Burkholderiales bacterium]